MCKDCDENQELLEKERKLIEALKVNKDQAEGLWNLAEKLCNVEEERDQLKAQLAEAEKHPKWLEDKLAERDLQYTALDAQVANLKALASNGSRVQALVVALEQACDEIKDKLEGRIDNQGLKEVWSTMRMALEEWRK